METGHASSWPSFSKDDNEADCEDNITTPKSRRCQLASLSSGYFSESGSLLSTSNSSKGSSPLSELVCNNHLELFSSTSNSTRSSSCEIAESLRVEVIAFEQGVYATSFKPGVFDWQFVFTVCVTADDNADRVINLVADSQFAYANVCHQYKMIPDDSRIHVKRRIVSIINIYPSLGTFHRRYGSRAFLDLFFTTETRARAFARHIKGFVGTNSSSADMTHQQRIRRRLFGVFGLDISPDVVGNGEKDFFDRVNYRRYVPPPNLLFTRVIGGVTLPRKPSVNQQLISQVCDIDAQWSTVSRFFEMNDNELVAKINSHDYGLAGVENICVNLEEPFNTPHPLAVVPSFSSIADTAKPRRKEMIQLVFGYRDKVIDGEEEDEIFVKNIPRLYGEPVAVYWSFILSCCQDASSQPRRTLVPFLLILPINRNLFQRDEITAFMTMALLPRNDSKSFYTREVVIALTEKRPSIEQSHQLLFDQGSDDDIIKRWARMIPVYFDDSLTVKRYATSTRTYPQLSAKAFWILILISKNDQNNSEIN